MSEIVSNRGSFSSRRSGPLGGSGACDTPVTALDASEPKPRIADIEKQIFKGKVVFVDVKAVAASKVEVWAEVENPDNVLRAGLPAKMTIFPVAP